MFYLAGIIISFFLTILLVSKRNKSTADKILATWILLAGIHLLFYYFYISGNYLNFPYYLGIELAMPLLHGPFLLLYTIALTTQGRFKINGLLHFLPFLLFFILLSGFIFSPVAVKIKVYQNQGLGYQSLLDILFICIAVSGIVYAGLSLRILALHQRNIKQHFSNTDKINLRWLTYLILGMAVIWLVVIFGNDQLTFAAVVSYLFFIGYFGIKQVGIFTNEQSIPVRPISKTIIENESYKNSQIKYARSGVGDKEINLIHEKLQSLIASEKLYTNPELTLRELAAKLDIHPNILSQVINSKEGQNFFDYINQLRIDEFKRLIKISKNEEYTLLALAFECGFNSKTSFNRNFKKITGYSPTEFIKGRSFTS